MSLWTLVLLLASILVSMPAFGKANDGWYLVQQSQAVGEREVYLSPLAFRALEKKRALLTICKAPQYKIEVINLHTHLRYETTPGHWIEALLGKYGNAITGILDQKPHRTTLQKQIGCCKSQLYLLKGADIKTVNNNNFKSAEVWLTDDIKIAPPLLKILCAFYGLPNLNRLALEVTYVKPNGIRRSSLSTSVCQKRTFSDRSFAPPAGLKIAHSEPEVYLDEKSKDFMELFSDFDRYKGK